MNESSAPSEERGIWLSSDEVHQLRDHIHAIKVAHSLLSSGHEHTPNELNEIYDEMAEAIQDLAQSVLFRNANGNDDGDSNRKRH